MLTKYFIRVEQVNIYTAILYAENKESAMALAEDMPLGDFNEDQLKPVVIEVKEVEHDEEYQIAHYKETKVGYEQFYP